MERETSRPTQGPPTSLSQTAATDVSRRVTKFPQRKQTDDPHPSAVPAAGKGHPSQDPERRGGALALRTEETHGSLHSLEARRPAVAEPSV